MKANDNPISRIDVPSSHARVQDMHEVDFLKTYYEAGLNPPLIDIVTPQPQTSKVFFSKLTESKTKKRPVRPSGRVSRPRKVQG